MIAAALTFSCQKAELEDNVVVDNNNNEVVDFVPGPGKILAVTPTGPETKIALGEKDAEGKYPVVWTSKDAIKLYSEENLNGETYTFGEGNGSQAVFTGNEVKGDTRYAVFPDTRALGMTEDGKLSISFGALRKQEYHRNC